MNDGTRDIGNTQAPVLLFRGLDPLSGPQAIAQAMKLSSGPGKEGAKGMRRIILIKDKVSMASWGFAFVEFVDTQVRSGILGNDYTHRLDVPVGSGRPWRNDVCPDSPLRIPHIRAPRGCIVCSSLLFPAVA